jgi:hypothetical protein
MHAQGSVGPTGNLGLRVIRNGQLPGEVSDWPCRPVKPTDVLSYGVPQLGEPPEVNRWRLSNLRNLWRGWHKIQAARALKLPHFYGQLWLTVFRGDGSVEELGLASMRVVTTTGAESIVDAFMNTFELESYDFHGFGVGVGAEAVGNTALGTEETTQYNPDNTRPTGTPSEFTSLIYRSVATYAPDSGTNPRPITEHGLFSNATVGSGVLLDRSVFSVVNLVPAVDSLQATYDFTVAAGG